jgi:hypothetical protein
MIDLESFSSDRAAWGGGRGALFACATRAWRAGGRFRAEHFAESMPCRVRGRDNPNIII